MRIVNVASVKHRSPFRYPGGKTWLFPLIRQWLSCSDFQPGEFIEPFAGGAIVGLSVAFEELARHVTLVELDHEVAAVWEIIINSDEGTWLAHAIESFHLTPEDVDALLARNKLTLPEQALHTIIRNRINRGGILAAGAGRLKMGENGKGIASRWYPDTLKQRILDIVAIRARLGFISGDGLAVIQQHAQDDEVVFFIDPPYTASVKKPGNRLYNYSDLNHQDLFTLMGQVRGDFLMTYENTEEIRNLAYQCGFQTHPVAMKSTHHARQTELLIGRDLGWL